LEDLGEVEGTAVGVLGDLLTTAEAVGDDEPVVRGLADCGEKFEFSDSLGDFIVFATMEAEGTCHATASRGRSSEVNTETTEERLLGRHLHERLVMAVAMDQGFAIELRESRVCRHFLFEKFAEQERLTP